MKIKINYDCGDLTSDSGLLFYEEFDEKIYFSKSIQETLELKDNEKYRVHSYSDIALQIIYQNVAWYHTNVNVDELIIYPIFRAVLGKNSFTSQQTLS